MTFFEKLAEKVGIKEAIRSIYNDCPSDCFVGVSEFCPKHRRCSACWSEGWKDQEFKDTEEKAIYPGDIVFVDMPEGVKIGRVKNTGDEFIDVWLDQTNIPTVVNMKRVRKIVNAHVITDDVLGGTDEEVERGLRDAYKV